MALLSISNLKTRHLYPASLDLETGEIVWISGPTGSGKSLLLRAIADLDPHEGGMSLDSVDSKELTATSWRRQVGYLAAESHWWTDTVGDHFAHASADFIEQLPAELGGLGLPPEAVTWAVNRLSSGEKQRLALLRLMACRPRVMLLDETGSHLDQATREMVENRIRAWLGEKHAAIWVAHDSGGHCRLGGRCFEMNEGKLKELT